MKEKKEKLGEEKKEEQKEGGVEILAGEQTNGSMEGNKRGPNGPKRISLRFYMYRRAMG